MSTSYTASSSAPPSRPDRKDSKPLPLRAVNPDPAPSYPVPPFAQNAPTTRRSSSARALPPYPASPPSSTGWAALSDAKVAAALAAPPHYPADPNRAAPSAQSSPMSSPRTNISRSISVASSSISSVPSMGDQGPFARPPEQPRGRAVSGARGPDEQPPYYYPPPSRLRLPISPGANPSMPLQSQNRGMAGRSVPPARAPAEMSNWSGPSGASQDPQAMHRSNGGPQFSHPAMQSTHSFASTSSSTSDRATSVAPAPFIYPSARTRARPSGAPSPGFKFRARRKLKVGTQPAIDGVLAAVRSSSSGEVRSTNDASPTLQPRAAASAVSIGSGSSSGASVSPSTSAGGPRKAASVSGAAEPFYFPSARTRAHPKAPGIHFGGKGKKKEAGSVGGGTKLPTGFLRMGLKGTKKSPETTSPPTVIPSPSPASEQETSLVTSSSPQEESSIQPDESYVDMEADGETYSEMEVPHQQPQITTKLGAYPLDPYDVSLMEVDKQTWDLIRRLNRTHGGPSFHNYAGRPPRSVLDLGCGAGWWALDAATSWRGTKIVGFDMMDTMRGMWPSAQRQGVADNIQFVRGNFVLETLPFADASFDLVRMANLALCIPRSRWEFVLQEVHRVLVIGGRLEFLDDHSFYPYSKPAAGTPHLDTQIPSTEFSRMSVADVVHPRGTSDSDSDVYNLYGLEEEDEDEGTNVDLPQVQVTTPGRPVPSIMTTASVGTAEFWNEQADSAKELEALFEHMLAVKYGIHPRPAEFVFEVMLRVFAGVKEITAMHLTLAPPEPTVPQTTLTDLDALAQCPGLLLYPSTVIPLSPAELEANVTKHQRVLLSTKSALLEYAREVATDGEAEMQGEAAQEALWEYQNFLRERFNPPVDEAARLRDDGESIRGSQRSVRSFRSSVSSEALSDMQDYQSELQSRYDVTPETGRGSSPLALPATLKSGTSESSAPPTRSPADTYSPHPVSDRVLILVTGDSEHFVNVDISGAPNPAFIRERVFTKLAIFDEEEQASLSIYRTEIGSFAIGDALDDDKLFELCRESGDEKGSLKLLVSTSAARVHEVPPSSGTLVPPYIPFTSPLQPNRRRSRSRNDSLSSASENLPAESSAGYDADMERERTTIRGLAVPNGGLPQRSASPLPASRSASPLPPIPIQSSTPLYDKQGNLIPPPPPPPPLSPSRASFVDDNVTPPGTILHTRVASDADKVKPEPLPEDPRKTRPQRNRAASQGRERRHRNKPSYHQSDAEESPSPGDWVFVPSNGTNTSLRPDADDEHPPTPIDARNSPSSAARAAARQQFSPSRYKPSSPYPGRSLAIPAAPRNAPPPIPATSPMAPPSRGAGQAVPPKWAITYKGSGEQKTIQSTSPATWRSLTKSAKSMDNLRGGAMMSSHPANLQPGNGRGRPPPLPVTRTRDPLLSAGAPTSLGTPKSFDGSRSYVRPLPIQGSSYTSIHEFNSTGTNSYGSRAPGSTLMSPSHEPYPRPQSAFGETLISPQHRYQRQIQTSGLGPSLDSEYTRSPRAPSPTHAFPSSSSSSALPYRSIRTSEPLTSPASPRSPRFISRDRRPGSSSSSVGNDVPSEPTTSSSDNTEVGTAQWAAQVFASAESTMIPTIMPPPNGTMMSTRSYDDSDSDDNDTGTWKQAPKSNLRPPLTVQIDDSGGTLKPVQNVSSLLRPASPSAAAKTKREKHGSAFVARQEDTWAPRPPPEDVYERLEEYFPEHDLDKPVIEAASGGTSPTSTDQISVPAPLTPATGKEKDKGRLRAKKSIRIVAQEHKRKIDRSSRAAAVDGMTAMQRKRSTKMWGSKVEEMDTSNLPESPSTADISSTTTFKWVRGDLIGRGTYGRVYLALNATTGEMMAVKQVEIPRTASDKNDSRQVTVVQALKMESETLKVLDHPNIVQYLGFEETPSNLSIFLEYVPGGSIGSCLAKHGKFEEDVTKSFTSQILAGLEYLHSKGVIHRDLKSDNILVEMTGICKISDFGISKRTDDQNDAHTAMQGTVFWMAPEVINTQKKGYNSKIDIWSIGCVVLEMWAGTRPWTGDEMVAVMFKLFQSKQPPPIPDGLVLTAQADDFRRKCFAINPDERPPAAELRKHPYLVVTPGWEFDGFVRAGP
ncbi:MAP kinase kinase kinase [Mycena kentingensis (nom. inval.)]|nr:MAP kinase kinase kinase [Mycena kentingensis (nom. inval.)]